MRPKKYTFEPDYAVPPGESIRDVIASMGMTQRDFATRLDTSVQNLNRLLRGEQGLSVEMAHRLERVTGVPASFWNNLESQYRTQLARLREKEEVHAQKEWLAKIPVAELKKRGYLECGLPHAEIFEAVLRFFGVSNVSAWEKTWVRPSVAARRSKCFEHNPHTAATWIRMGELAAQSMDCGPTDIRKFRGAMEELRLLTTEEPSAFVPKLVDRCQDCGVALVLVPEFPGLSWSGATKWIGDTAVIMLNLRGKREDKFWFSFFHEAGHVIRHSKLDLLINDGGQEDVREKEANEFACTVLFGKDHARIPSLRSTADIKAFAASLNLSPGIVAGQYQFMTGRYTYFHNLFRAYEWTTAQKH